MLLQPWPPPGCPVQGAVTKPRRRRTTASPQVAEAPWAAGGRCQQPPPDGRQGWFRRRSGIGTTQRCAARRHDAGWALGWPVHVEVVREYELRARVRRAVEDSTGERREQLDPFRIRGLGAVVDAGRTGARQAGTVGRGDVGCDLLDTL